MTGLIYHFMTRGSEYGAFMGIRKPIALKLSWYGAETALVFGGRGTRPTV